MSQLPMVIVGAGQTGARAALALRARGWNGRIVVLGEEVHEPYERPALSKTSLASPEVPPTLVADASRYVEHDIELRLHTRVISLDARDRCVCVASSNGTAAIPFDKLLLATGGRARRL